MDRAILIYVMTVPKPIICEKCGSTAAVHVFMRVYLCTTCWWRRGLTTEEVDACYAPLCKRAVTAPVEQINKDERPQSVCEPTVYAPGDLVADFEEGIEIEKPFDTFFSRVRAKAGIDS